MTQSSQDPNWLAIWLTALVPVVVAIGAFVKRFFASVTRAELRESNQDFKAVIDERHAENLKRFEKQDEELKLIRSGLARIEGSLSGRYPQIKGP